MQTLNTFLSLISKTEGRDKVLRLFQYACLHSVDHAQKGGAFRVYQQMRMTRKLLRFLRTLDYSARIKKQIPQLAKTFGHTLVFLKHLTGVLHNLFTFLFFLYDHKVCLSELNVFKPHLHKQLQSKSMGFYFLQNVFGVLHNLVSMIVAVIQSKDTRDLKKMILAVKHYSFDMVRCFLDCLIAAHYWRSKLSARTTGVIGVVTSVMAIMQSIEKM